MADRDRERVRRMVGLRHLCEPEDRLDHLLHLLLLGAAVAADTLLTVAGAYSERPRRRSHRDEDGPAGLADGERDPASAPTNDSSSTSASGACSAIRPLTPSSICFSRCAGGSRGDVFHRP